MSILLKLWAAVAVAFAGAGQQGHQVKAQSLSGATSCVVHPIYCAKGWYTYTMYLDNFSKRMEDGLGQSYVEIGKDWDSIKIPQERSEL